MTAKPAAALALERMIEQLEAQGFAVALNYIDADFVAALRTVAMAREAEEQESAGRVGRDGDRVLDTRVRNSRHCWIDGRSPPETAFLALADDLRVAINRRLFLGLFEFEAQFLTYPAGGYYRRHVDSHRGSRDRMVSLVAYLNDDWSLNEGGALKIWPADTEGGEPIAIVQPLAGTVVLMLSEDIPHEAEVAHRTRRAIAGWFRVNASTGDRADPAR